MYSFFFFIYWMDMDGHGCVKLHHDRHLIVTILQKKMPQDLTQSKQVYPFDDCPLSPPVIPSCDSPLLLNFLVVDNKG